MKRKLTALLAGALLAGAAVADEAAIRKNLLERLPQVGRIDEVSKSPVPGLFEVRVGTDIFYTDAEGNYLIEGQVLDLRQRRNLTEERQQKLLAINFRELPLKDAFTIVRGDGKRRLAVFQDPNCGYCKKFERDLQKVDNVTIHMFLYPVLGLDSVTKSRNIWCSKDRAKAWQDWMIRDVAAPAAPSPGCDTTALERNRDFGRKHQISGTPTLLFADGRRVPGAISAAQLEKLLSETR